MKKTLIAAIALASASGVFAKTTIFGEADANFLLVNTEAGSYSTVNGDISEFGFKGVQAINEAEEAFFYLAYNADILANYDSPWLNEGHVGIRGSYGEVAFFADLTPLGHLNDNYFIMDNSIDQSVIIMGGIQAISVGVPVGVWASNGIRYASPVFDGGISFEAAYVPEEANNAQTMIDGKAGFSVAGHYTQNSVNLSAALEVNVEADDATIFRVSGDVKTGDITLGGTFQSASNSALNMKSTHVGGFVKVPANMSGTPMNIRVLAAMNTISDNANNSAQEFYTSAVIEVPFTSKVSSYSFLNIYSFNDMAETMTMGGGGLKVRF